MLTPPLVENPGMETHIHPFQAYHAHTKKLSSFYLQTSPEFHMKKLLAENQDLNQIFTLSYCFRDEPNSPVHRSQFIMLEWYRKFKRYESIMDDTENLVRYCQDFFKDHPLAKNKIKTYPQISIAELFHEFLQMNILDFLDPKELKNKIKNDFKDVPLPDVDCSWDDYYFLLFLNKIEPELINYPYLLLKEFPAPLSALSTLSKKDDRVCERFEVYLSGVELCNCFNELTSYQEQKKRFKQQAKDKKDIYQYELPWPNEFMGTLKNGYPESSGIALGVERLLYALLKIENPFFT